MFVTDQAPYLFRISGGEENANVKHKEIDTLVGATMAWNQQINPRVQDDTVQGVHVTVDANGLITLNGTSENAGIVRLNSPFGFPVTVGHKYAFIISGTLPTGVDYVQLRKATTATDPDGSAYQNITTSTIFYYTETGYGYIVPRVYFSSGASINGSFHVYCVDLTLALGPTIADYVYTLESGTAGAGVAWLKAHGFFTKDYYSYDPGSLQSVCVSAHIMRDADDQIIASYPLDHSVTRRGIYKLDENNKLYADGDTDDGKGTMTVKYGVVDLGTLTWTKGTYAFYSDGTGLKTGSTNVVCAKYPNVGTMSGADMPDKSISPQSSGRIYIKDSIYSDAATFTTAVSGVYLVYELATPTTETVEPFTNPQQVDRYGTEEYVDFPYFVEDRDVEVPVGHITQYPQ